MNDKYRDAQYALAVQLQKDWMGDVLTEVQFSNYSDHFYASLVVIANCGLDASRIEACNDISSILHAVAMKMAEKKIDEAEKSAAEDLAITNYELMKNGEELCVCLTSKHRSACFLTQIARLPFVRPSVWRRQKST